MGLFKRPTKESPQSKAFWAEVTPLLKTVWPDKTKTQQMYSVAFFTKLHQAQYPTDLDQPHIDALIGALRYSAAAKTHQLVQEWPGLQDACKACLDFKATLLEAIAGFKVAMDTDGHVIKPVTIADQTTSGLQLTDQFKFWLVHGSEAIRQGDDGDSG